MGVTIPYKGQQLQGEKTVLPSVATGQAKGKGSHGNGHAGEPLPELAEES